MNKILTKNEITKFKEDGAIFLKNKFDINWINKLKTGIEKDISNPSPRFKSHTTKKNVPAYLEDYWTWHLIPDILGNKDKYEFLQWDCELGDAVVFDMRTLHGSLNESIPDKTLSRYTLRVSKEDAKISYDGDWTSFNYRKAMQEAGYKNGDPVEGEMFPTLYEALD